MSELCGVVLAGGKSTRFGSNKALASHEGVALLDKSISLLNQLEIQPTIITSKENTYSDLRYPKLQDLYPESGPLGGVYTALSILNAPILVLTCDMPMLKKETLELLRRRCLRSCDSPSKSEKRKNGSKVPELGAVVFRISDRMFQPFPGIYYPSGLKIARQHLNRKQLSMQDFLRKLPNIRDLGVFDQSPQFVNINYPSDLP